MWRNLLTIAKQIRARAAEKGAKKVEIVVDCVAYAPHRKMDVRDWDVDYAVFSFYKVCREFLRVSLGDI